MQSAKRKMQNNKEVYLKRLLEFCLLQFDIYILQ